LTVLKTIKDEGDAIAAKENLKTLSARWLVTERELRTLTTEGVAALAKNKPILTVTGEIKKEYERLCKSPAVYEVLAEFFPLEQIEQDYVKITRADVIALSSMLSVWKEIKGVYPKSLDELKQPFIDGTPLATADQLVDPWGRPYRYDPQRSTNKLRVPAVWSEGPPRLKRAGTRIGNSERN